MTRPKKSTCMTCNQGLTNNTSKPNSNLDINLVRSILLSIYSFIYDNTDKEVIVKSIMQYYRTEFICNIKSASYLINISSLSFIVSMIGFLSTFRIDICNYGMIYRKIELLFSLYNEIKESLKLKYKAEYYLDIFIHKLNDIINLDQISKNMITIIFRYIKININSILSNYRTIKDAIIINSNQIQIKNEIKSYIWSKQYKVILNSGKKVNMDTDLLDRYQILQLKEVLFTNFYNQKIDAKYFINLSHKDPDIIFEYEEKLNGYNLIINNEIIPIVNNILGKIEDEYIICRQIIYNIIGNLNYKVLCNIKKRKSHPFIYRDSNNNVKINYSWIIKYDLESGNRINKKIKLNSENEEVVDIVSEESEKSDDDYRFGEFSCFLK